MLSSCVMGFSELNAQMEVITHPCGRFPIERTNCVQINSTQVKRNMV